MMETGNTLKNVLSRSSLWAVLRERRIIRSHRKVAQYCESLLERYRFSPAGVPVRALKSLPDEKIIWQYWAQGFADAPEAVKRCAASVDKWKGDYSVIRLDERNLSEYIEFPDYMKEAGKYMSKAHFSDILRVCLLYLYGGIWMDATIFMSGPVPEYVFKGDFFVYQRDSEETDKKYWKNVYAYYFGWTKGFRVNMLNSFIYSRKGADSVALISGVLLYYWSEGKKYLPDYFFFQILYDVLIKGHYGFTNCRIVGDCKPHYLQQLTNDPDFSLATREEILRTVPIHKLTWK